MIAPLSHSLIPVLESSIAWIVSPILVEQQLRKAPTRNAAVGVQLDERRLLDFFKLDGLNLVRDLKLL